MLAVGLVLAVAPATAAAAEPPHVGATWSTGVSASAATVSAEVNPEGSTTTYRFEYIPAGPDYAAHGFEHAAKQPSGAPAGLGEGTSDVLATQHLVPLSAATTYHYRVSATNSAGTTPGPDKTFTTQEAGATFALPDARGWEMVSPINKNGGAIQGPGGNFGGDLLQAAAQGGGITYSSGSAFGQAPAGVPPASQYLARREAGGWSTENITAPTVSGSYGQAPDGVPYRLFSPDLAHGLMLNGVRCRAAEGQCPVANPPLPGSGAPSGYQDYYLRASEGGAFTALITAANAELGLSAEQFEVSFAGASPDLRHVVLSTCAKLTADATEVPEGEGCDPTKLNLYEWSGGGLRLINILPGHTEGTPGATLAAQAGAVSTDGSRVYFNDGGSLYLRELPTEGVTCGIPCSGAQLLTAGAEFQTATPSGAFAFYTNEVSAGDVHLYRYSAAGASTDLTPSGGVEGVLGASADGSSVFYQDNGGILLPPISPGLFLWHEGTVTQVAFGGEAAQPSDYPPVTGTARVSPDGETLLFLSKAELSGYDNTDQASGEPDLEVFLWRTTGGGLRCLSCNPTNARPLGPSTIPGAIANGATDSYKPRALSANGARVFFNSADALLPADTDGRPDVYQWQAQGSGGCAKPAGCLGLLSGGRSGEASFIDASESGGDGFFLTEASLIGADPGSVDLYDAREGGGFAEAPGPIECLGDACQPLPEAPEDPTVGTQIPGRGNPPLRSSKPSCPKGKHRVVRHGKSRCVAQHHKRRGSK
jgi:hypothetical protein